MNKSLLFLAIASTLGAAAHAQTAAAAPVTTNFSLTSNYKYRGQDQGNQAANFKPAIQGGFDYSNSGFYLGNWNSSIGWVPNGNVELDFYGGYKGEIMPGFGYDAGVLTYVYPGSSFANTTEVYGALSYSILTFKYSHTVSSKYFGVEDGQNTGYFDLAANYEVMGGLTLNAHVGSTRFSSGAKDVGAVNYTDYKLGATYDLGSGFSLAGAWIGANKRSTYGDINKARFIVTLTKAM
jgi:uncharacterized protein (TIGR02001 family)